MSISYEETEALETLEFSSNPTINSKVKQALSGLQPTIKRMVSRFPTDQDKEQVANFLLACMRQENVAVKSKRVYVTALNYLSKYHRYNKPFWEMSDKDISDYLGSLYKDRKVDPDQGWISNHNTMAMGISKFYRFLYYPNKSPQERRHKLSKDELEKIVQLRKVSFISTSGKPRSPIKSRDKWDSQDFATALKHIGKWNPRLACFIAFMKDLSARPDEVLKLTLADVDNAIKMTSEGSEYALVEVGRHSKKKTPRVVPLVHAIKYYRVWREQHPTSDKPDAPIFISREHSAKYQNIPMSADALRFELKRLKRRYFPTLLKRPNVPEEEKKKIEKLLSRKFTPYSLRHSSIQQYVRSGISEYDLKLHAGWSKTSNMIEVYTTEEGGESAEDILRMTYKIDTRNKKQQQELEQELQGTKCPHCGIQNIQHATTCIECGKVIDPIKLGIIIEESERTQQELEDLKTQLSKMENSVSVLKGVIFETPKVEIEAEEGEGEIKEEVKELHRKFDWGSNNKRKKVMPT